MGSARTCIGLRDKVSYLSPIGWIEVEATGRGVAQVRFVSQGVYRKPSHNPHLKTCIRELEEYFLEKRRSFEVALDLQGTSFQKRVWGELLKIRFGQTTSYAAVAKALRRPQACRAVGQANRKNPVALIVPCHRVVTHDQKIGGYAAGVRRKQWLLRHEGVCLLQPTRGDV